MKCSLSLPAECLVLLRFVCVLRRTSGAKRETLYFPSLLPSRSGCRSWNGSFRPGDRGVGVGGLFFWNQAPPEVEGEGAWMGPTLFPPTSPWFARTPSSSFPGWKRGNLSPKPEQDVSDIKKDISLRRISDFRKNHRSHPVREETQEGESPSILLRKLHARALPPSPPFRHRERRILCVVRIVLLSIL